MASSLLQSKTHVEFLNDLCNKEEPINTNFSELEQNFLSEMTAADWLSWLDTQNGREKLTKFVNNKNGKTKCIISRIKDIEYYVLQLSINDFSRLTDPEWTHISKHDKTIVQSVLTLPYPHLTKKWKEEEEEEELILQFLNVNLPTGNYSLSNSIQVATNILEKIGLDMYNSNQMTKFLNVFIQAINNLILHQDENKNKIILTKLNTDLISLFVLLFHPVHQNKIQDVRIFIKFVVNFGLSGMFTNYNDNIFYSDLKIFAKSAEKYFEYTNQTEKENQDSIVKTNQTWWNFVCNEVFIEYFKYVSQPDYRVSMLNDILQTNPSFMSQMLTCTSSIRKKPGKSMIMWKRLAPKIAQYDLFKNSEIGGHIATLLYHTIGIPCLDILESDKYVNSLSEDDKELLTLWTHACNLFQHHPTSTETIATKKESDEITDLDRKSYLRNRLHQIFMQAPKTNIDLVFYRGLKTKCTTLKRQSNNPMAVSFDKRIANGFAEHGRGCLLKIIVPKYSNILAIDRASIYGGDESEILLMPNSSLVDIPINEDEEEERNVSEFYKESNAIVKFEIDENETSQIIPLSKPSFVHKQMTPKEFGYILIKSGLVSKTSDVTDLSQMLDEITNYDPSGYKTMCDSLFESIRTAQILYCGFGDVDLVIAEFWTQAFYAYLKSPNFLKLRLLKNYCDVAWTPRKTLMDSHNKISVVLDALQDFVKSFALE